MHTEPSKQREQIHLENVMDGIKDGVEADAQNATVDKIEDQAQYSAKELHGILRRIDLRVVPALGLMFGISLMDRSNISAAIIAGMEKDLHLQVGYRYSLIILCFFITYVIVQIPMTIVCRKLGPRYFLPGVCGLWGGLIVGFGFSNNWTTLLALRLVLGCLEAGYFPGSVYLLSTWYTRYETASRYSWFYLIGVIYSSLAGILAYGLMQMNGLQGIEGWRWIFIMEGVITTLIAAFAAIVMVQFPDQEREKPTPMFLKPEEVQFIIARLQADRSDVEAEPFSWSKFLKPAKDFEIWGFALMQFCMTTTSYAYTFYLPIILRSTLHFSIGQAQCLVCPPYFAAALLMLSTAWYGDRHHMRGPLIIFNCCIALIGLPIVGFATNPWVRYFGVFLAVAAVNSNIPTIMTYQANNIRGQWKRAFCSATLTGIAGTGGVAGSLIFRTQDAPKYVPGFVATIVCTVVTIIICCGLMTYFRWANKKADEGKKVINGLAGFRYTI